MNAGDFSAKPFQRGLVVGKFSPLHRGHELVIRHAFELCREVVLISYSNPELPGCEAARRQRWLAQLFPQAHRLVVKDDWLRQRFPDRNGSVTVPPNDAEDLVHRRFVGFLCAQGLGLTVDTVFTSEDYGDGFARELTNYFREHNSSAPEVRHIQVDLRRTEVPVSGSQIRADVEANRHWLSPVVYASFVRRVCILGGESCGKSTLAEALAIHFGTVHVSEYGRELWEAKNGSLTYEDMLHIAQTQVAAEEQACLGAKRFLFCDTSPLTTLFYSQHLFQSAEAKLEQLAQRRYDLVVLCAADFAFVQDGTRQDANFRGRQNAWYINELDRRRVPFLQVTGGLSERIAQVRERLKGPKSTAERNG
jgi:HTH-type transcriptional regulator, transcriptional repressor of NAD biosynthesis genes